MPHGNILYVIASSILIRIKEARNLGIIFDKSSEVKWITYAALRH